MPHVRSQPGWKKREQRRYNFFEQQQLRDAVRAEICDYSRCDPVTGEKAFHPEDRQKITRLLLEGGCSIEKPYNIFTKQPPNNGLARHVKNAVMMVEREWHNFNPDTISTVLNGIEDGQVLNRPN